MRAGFSSCAVFIVLVPVLIGLGCQQSIPDVLYLPTSELLPMPDPDE